MVTDDMIGIKKLFGDEITDENEFQLVRLFAGTVTTFKNDSRYSFSEMMDTFKKFGLDDGERHPTDSEYYQVPAKLLIGKNGDVRIITKNHLDIKLFRLGEESGKILIDEVCKNGNRESEKTNTVVSQATT